MTGSPKQRTLAHVLETDAQFAEWTARYRREAALTRAVRKHLPRPIAERVRVTDARNGVLEIAAGAGAIAAAIRQRVPDLRSALTREGYDFLEVRVRVQVAGMVGPNPKALFPERDMNAATPLFELGDRIADGPLKAALRRWSRRARGR